MKDLNYTFKKTKQYGDTFRYTYKGDSPNANAHIDTYKNGNLKFDMRSRSIPKSELLIMAKYLIAVHQDLSND